MVKDRTCHECGTLIKSSTAYFCYACGAELADKPGLVKKRGSSFKPLANSSAPKPTASKRVIFTEKLKKFVTCIQAYKPDPHKLKATVVVIFIVSIVGLFSALLYWRNTRYKYSKFVRDAEFNGFTLTELDIGSYNFPEFHFKKSRFLELVPQNVDWYVEGSDTSFLFEKENSLLENYTTVLEEKLKLTLQEAFTFVSPRYAVFGRGNSSAFVTEVVSVPFAWQAIEAVGELQGFSGYLVGSYLVVTNDSSMVVEIEECLKKLTLSLSKDSTFSKQTRVFPDQGMFFVYGVWPSWVGVRPSAGSAWLVVSRDGGVFVVGNEQGN